MAKALIAAGILSGLLSLLIIFALLMSAVDGSPPRWYGVVILFLLAAMLGAISTLSITVGTYRLAGRKFDFSVHAIRMPRFDVPRAPLTVFLFALSLTLAVMAIVVASHVNKLEFHDYIAASANAILPWDPTRTARKYLVLAVLLAVGSFALFRSVHRGRSIAVLPALMLILAVPLGGVGYEMRSNYWSYSYWIEKGLDGREEMVQDPYLYLGEPQAENSIAIRVRNDMVQLLQLAERSGMGSSPDHWNELRELELEVRQRRRTGLALVVLAIGLFGGAIYIVRRERSAS